MLKRTSVCEKTADDRSPSRYLLLVAAIAGLLIAGCGGESFTSTASSGLNPTGTATSTSTGDNDDPAPASPAPADTTEPSMGGANCTPATCAQLNATCGKLPDGCGDVLSCGICADGRCESNGASWSCQCLPKSCDQLQAECGIVSDECGGSIDCGGCTAPSSCLDNRCDCTPKATCGENECGTVPDGCGGTLDCGGCDDPTNPNCGGGGPNLCGPDPCEPTSCEQIGANCGEISDGCGEILNCGECTAPDECGAGMIQNQCGCQPLTCDEVGAECGKIDNGCGEEVACANTCQGPNKCGGGRPGERDPNKCGCTPLSCEKLDAECGQPKDGCGLTLNCGRCDPDEKCEVLGQGKRRCVDSCEPKTCKQLGAECGQIDNGCGKIITCGSDETCKEENEYLTCGGGGEPNKCGCTRKECGSDSCGEVPDGCGGTLKCSCPNDTFQCIIGFNPKELGVCIREAPCLDVSCPKGLTCCNGNCSPPGAVCIQPIDPNK